MAIKEIIWSVSAKRELASTLDFYLLQNGSATYSNKLLSEIEELMTILKNNEFIGRLTKNKFTRTLPMRSYSIFYEVHANSIWIVSFWDNRRNPSSGKIEK